MYKLLPMITVLIGLSLFAGEARKPVTGEQQKITYDTTPAPVPLNFSEEKIRSYRQQTDFNYSEREEQETWWTMFKRYIILQWQKFLSWIVGDTEISGFLLFLLKMIPYLLLLTFLGFMVWVFKKLNPARSLLSTSHESRVNVNEEEKIVRSQNIRALIEEAVMKEEYRLAIRYHYLFLLQHLNRNRFINYEFSKTDEDYLEEIQEEEIKSFFKKLSRIYDFIWYGNFGVSREDYLKISKQFREMEQLTGSKNEQRV